MTRTRAFNFFIILALLLSSAIPSAAEQWQEDFEKLCAYVDNAETFTTEELKGFIADCDELIKKIEVMDTPKKKLYLFRLKKCRNFYKFTLDVKESKETAK
jgi:hypothetical protein